MNYHSNPDGCGADRTPAADPTDDECRALVEKSAALLQSMHARRRGGPAAAVASVDLTPTAAVDHPARATTDASPAVTQTAAAAAYPDGASQEEEEVVVDDQEEDLLFSDPHSIDHGRGFAPLADTGEQREMEGLLRELTAAAAPSGAVAVEEPDDGGFSFLSVEQQRAVFSSKLCELYTLLHIFFA